MVENFKDCLSFTLKWEGGFSNDPDDPGGATNMGVTQSVYNAWRKSKGLPQQSVKNLTRAEAEAIYDERYWTPSRAKWLAKPLDLAVFDTAVNFGVGRSTEFVAVALGLPKTTKWTEEMSKRVHDADPGAVANAVCAQRSLYRIKRVLEAPSQTKFLKGWTNRDTALLLEVIKIES